jgi:hypothetical protein
MAVNDIRRNLADVSPTNYIRPGVENHAIGDAITGITQGALAIDAAIQTEKLGDQLDAARASFIVGSPATESAYATGDSAVDEAIDKELAPLRSVLESRKAAVEQGSISSSRFAVEADNILQRAISKRPGLAPEYRQMHAQYTGGALIEELTKREIEMMREHAKEQESKDKQTEQTIKDMVSDLEKIGSNAEARNAQLQGPQAVIALHRAMQQDISRFAKREADAAYWKATTGIQGDQQTMERGSAVNAWGAQFDLAHENVGRSVKYARQQLLSTTDEDSYAGMLNQFDTALGRVQADLEKQRVDLGLKPEDVSERMAVLRKYREDIPKFLDGSVSFDIRKRNSEKWMLQLEARLRTDQPVMAAMAALDKLGGPIFTQKVLDESAVLESQASGQVVSFLLDAAGMTDGPVGRVDAVAPLAAGFTASILKDMFPGGSATKEAPKPEDMATLSKLGIALAVIPNPDFRASQYADWVRELSYFSEVLAEKPTEEQRQSLAQSVGMAAYKNVKVGMIQLLQDVPTLKAGTDGKHKLVWNSDWDSDEPIAAREGQKLSPQEQQALDLANSRLAYGPTLDVLQKIAHLPSKEAAGKWIVTSNELVAGQEALRTTIEGSQKRSKARAGQGSMGGTGAVPREPTEPLRGPSARWWE